MDWSLDKGMVESNTDIPFTNTQIVFTICVYNCSSFRQEEPGNPMWRSTLSYIFTLLEQRREGE